MGRHRKSPCYSFWPPSIPSPTPCPWSQQQNENYVQYVFYRLFVRTHTKFGIKNWNWHRDLLTSPQGHQFDSRMKMLLAFCSARHPRRFDMPHDHVWKQFFFDPLGTPSATKSHPGIEWKSLLICFVSFICENTHKVWYKNLWNWYVNRNLMIFDLLTSPQGHQFDPRMKILLAFCSACHPRRFDMPHDHVWKNFFWPPGLLKCPKVRPLGHDPGNRIKIPSDMFCIFHLWEQTQSLV